MKKTKNIFLISSLLFITFIIFTTLLKLIDVKMAGETNTYVGFSSLNEWVYNSLRDFSAADLWYNISEYLGYLAFISPVVFACIGLFQLVKTKKLSLVDKRLIALAVFYVVVVAFYFFFEKVVINCRPIFVDGAVEASYPSTHSLMSICLIGSSTFYFKRFISDNKKICVLYNVFSYTVMVLIILGRLLSSMHWFTDIIGAVLLSTSLLVLLYGCIKKLDN